MKHALFHPIDTHFRSIEIKTLTLSDIKELSPIMWQDQTIYHSKYQLDNLQKNEQWLEKLLIEHKNEISHPLVIKKDDEFLGITAFHSFTESHKRASMGGTWIFPHARQTSVNTELKLWALSYLLDLIRLNRVEFCVDEKNFPSQMAMIRLGVQFEGDRFDFYTSASDESSSAKIYSCTKTNWPKVKLRIQELLMANHHPKLFDIPEIIEDENIYFRRYRLSDAKALLGLIINNRIILKDNFPNQGKWNTVAEVEQGIVQWAHNWAQRNACFWGIFDSKTEQLIGQGLMKSIDWIQGSADIGYYLDEKYHGLGLGKKSIGILEHIAKELQLCRLSARVFPDNKASLNALRSRSFSEEGLLANAFRNSHGKLRDTNILGKIIQ